MAKRRVYEIDTLSGTPFRFFGDNKQLAEAHAYKLYSNGVVLRPLGVSDPERLVRFVGWLPEDEVPE